MRFLAVITLLILALAIAQPVAAQSFKPDFRAGMDAYGRNDYATALKHWWPLANPHVNNPIINRILSPKGKCNQTTNKCRTRSRSYFYPV